MKKNVLRGFAMTIVLMASVNVSAQINLGNLGSALASAVGSNLTSIISGSNNVTTENIAGTWSYEQPAITFESSNLLKQAGGKIAASTIESKLTKQFTKMGITKGDFLITFGTDGTFYTTKGGKQTSSGTYTISGSKITFSYIQGVSGLSGYAQLENSILSLSFDSSKLLKMVGSVTSKSSNSTLSTISSLAGSFDGMKTGLAFTKYVAPVVTPVSTTTTTTKAVSSSKKATSKKASNKKKSSSKKKSTKKKSSKK